MSQETSAMCCATSAWQSVVHRLFCGALAAFLHLQRHKLLTGRGRRCTLQPNTIVCTSSYVAAMLGMSSIHPDCAPCLPHACIVCLLPSPDKSSMIPGIHSCNQCLFGGQNCIEPYQLVWCCTPCNVPRCCCSSAAPAGTSHPSGGLSAAELAQMLR